ncbi:inositol monophosphatase family protein [Falsibacillus pallidus]|uniref:inositol-phosphate phosphatase n=1 Tax=Falsibacillus pallidus TaxID=493781 RepID=A0A370GVA4_9BACI|nr:inositol monophosphatase family protein [Falsibacillus pallidus]RDI47608.1 myo-inositol-1(or 4)-monophosphatase [Falsibacillus pallidus]
MSQWKEIDANAKKWLKEAGESIKASFENKLSVTTKSNPNDLVTNIDKETEQYFIQQIKNSYPDHRVFGEEGFGDEIETLDGIVWIIDPIDGTMNFIHQQRNFAISIGVYKNGKGKLGYIYDVVLDELYHAEAGSGAFLNDAAIPKLEKTPVSKAIVSLNATWVTPNKRIDHQTLTPLVKDVRGTRSYGSAALELAYVATGRLDAYITMRLSPWDYAGGKVIVEELGGKVTNLEGEELDLINPSPVFACKPGLHEEILHKYLLNEKK